MLQGVISGSYGKCMLPFEKQSQCFPDDPVRMEDFLGCHILASIWHCYSCLFRLFWRVCRAVHAVFISFPGMEECASYHWILCTEMSPISCHSPRAPWFHKYLLSVESAAQSKGALVRFTVSWFSRLRIFQSHILTWMQSDLFFPFVGHI